MLKNAPVDAGDMRHRFDPWARKMPWSRHSNPLPGFLPGESHGQRRLVGYTAWGHTKSDMTEQVN